MMRRINLNVDWSSLLYSIWKFSIDPDNDIRVGYTEGWLATDGSVVAARPYRVPSRHVHAPGNRDLRQPSYGNRCTVEDSP